MNRFLRKTNKKKLYSIYLQNFIINLQIIMIHLKDFNPILF